MQDNCRTDKMVLNVIPLLLAFLIPFGIITSFHDIRYGKIRNKHILVALLYGIFINLAYSFNLSYLGFVAVNASIALMVSFLAWYLTFCTAGDSKLFFAYSFLVPLGIYEYGFINYFPSATIIINTLLPAFAYFFIRLMQITDMEEKKEIFKKTVNFKSLSGIAILLFGFYWGIFNIMGMLGISMTGFMGPIIAILAIYYLAKRSGIDITKAAIILCILRLIFDYQGLMSVSFWISFAAMITMFTFLVNFVPELGRFMFSQEKKISELREHMMPQEAIARKGKKYVKVPLSKTVDAGKGFLVDYKASGLTKDDIYTLKQLRKDKRLDFETIIVHQTIPFAPLMFAGVLLTVLMSGNAYGFIYNYLF
ncbi:MAG: prepilin peptidase [Candidatus Aenigmarchaeota archaeon]|nr:prepilin peptidase [Candidatus Aenigmarchaeota archaeon]